MRIVRKLLLALAVAGLFVIVTGASGAKADSSNYQFTLKILDNDGMTWMVDGPFATALFDSAEQKYATSGDGWSFDDSSKVLTLNGFNGRGIIAEGQGTLGIVVKGENRIVRDSGDAWIPAMLIGRSASGAMTTIFSGDGTLTIDLNMVASYCFGGDTVIFKESPTLVCNVRTGEEDYDTVAYAATKTVLGKDATIKASCSAWSAFSSGGEGYLSDDNKDELDGTLILTHTGSNDYGAWRFTEYNSFLGKDRVIYCGISPDKLEKVKLEKGYGGVSYMSDADYAKAKVVIVCGKNDDISAIAGTISAVGIGKDSATIKKVSSTKKGQAKVTWKKVSGAKGYEIFTSDSENGEFKKAATVKKNAAKGTVKKLKSGSTVYFKVRSYTEKDGKKEYGEFSEVKKAKIK